MTPCSCACVKSCPNMASEHALPGHSGVRTWTNLDGVMFALCVGLLSLLPLTVHYWPGQDDPNHLAVAHILSHYADPAAPFQRFFLVHSLVKPYGLYYVLLIGLARLVPLVTADKVLVDAVIIGLPLSVLFLLRRVAPQRTRNVFLVIPFLTSWGLMAGFVAFHLAMIPAFLFVAVVWVEAEFSLLRAALGAGLLLLCAGLHPVVAVLAGLSLVVLELEKVSSPATWLKWIGVGLPAAAFLCASWYLGAGHAAGAHATAAPDADPAILYSPIHLVFMRFPRRALAALSALELPFRTVPFFLLAIGGYFSVRRSRLGGSRDGAIARWWLVLLLGYLVLPDVLFGWNLCGLHESVFLVFVSACVGWIPERVPHRWVGGITFVSLIALTAIQRRAIVALDRRVTTIVEVGSHAEAGSTLLPLLFDTRGGSFNARPLLHSWAHLVIQRDLVMPGIFAAGRSSMGGEPFRVLSFRQAFTSEFLPTLDEEPNLGLSDCGGNLFCELDRNHRACSTLAVAKAYDYVLVQAAPARFVALLLTNFELVARQDDVLLLHSPTNRPRKFEPSGCMLPL